MNCCADFSERGRHACVLEGGFVDGDLDGGGGCRGRLLALGLWQRFLSDWLWFLCSNHTDGVVAVALIGGVVAVGFRCLLVVCVVVTVTGEDEFAHHIDEDTN